MAVREGEIAIYGVLVNDTPGDVIAYAGQIYDQNLGENQEEINKNVYEKLQGVTGDIESIPDQTIIDLMDTLIPQLH